ncbi:MAG: hypothetical protein R6X18_02020 [Chloroflexota bacterium]
MELADNPVASITGYESRHLIPHLISCRRYDDAHRILNLSATQHAHAWYTAKEAAGEVSSFLADIDAIWRAVDRESPNPQTAAESPLGFQIRYALITSSVNSLARNLPTDLIASLIDSGVWDIPQALAYTRQMPFPQQQAETMLVLSAFLPAGDQSVVLEEALAAAWRIRGTRSPVATVAKIAQLLPSAIKAATWQEILAVASTTGLSVAKADAFVDLAAYIPEDMVEEFLNEAAGLGKPFRRAQALLGLAAYAPRRRQAIIQAIVEATRQIDNEEMRSEIIAGSAHLLPPDLLIEAQATTRRLESASARTTALTGLAPFLLDPAADETVEHTLGTIPQIRDEVLRANALLRLLPHLSKSQLVLVPEIIETFTKQESRAMTIAGSAPLLFGESLEATYSIALKMSTDRFKAQAIAGLIPFLPARHHNELAAAIEEHLASSTAQSVVLCRLSQYAPQPQKRALVLRALSAAQSISDVDAQSYVLVCLSKHFSASKNAGIKDIALSRTRQIDELEVRFARLLELLPTLTTGLQWEVLEEIRRLPEGFSDPAEQSRAFVQLMPWLKGEEAALWIDTTLAALGRIPKEPRRVALIEEIIADLPLITGKELLPLARAIVNPYWRTRAILAISSVPGTALDTNLLVAEILELIRVIPNEKQKSDALARSAQLLSQHGLLDTAMAEAHTLTSVWRKEQALSHLIAELAGRGFSTRARFEADALQYVACRGEALAGCLRFADSKSRSALIEELQPVIEQIMTRDPQAATLARLMPILAECGLPHLVIRVAPCIKDFALQARGLTAAIPYLPQESLDELSTIAATIEDERWRMEALLALLPYLLSVEKRQKIALNVLGLALTLDSLNARTAALRDLGPHLLDVPKDLWAKVLQDLFHRSARRTRENLLFDIGSLIPVLGGAEASDLAWEINQVIVDVTSWWP